MTAVCECHWQLIVVPVLSVLLFSCIGSVRPSSMHAVEKTSDHCESMANVKTLWGGGSRRSLRCHPDAEVRFEKLPLPVRRCLHRSSPLALCFCCRRINSNFSSPGAPATIRRSPQRALRNHRCRRSSARSRQPSGVGVRVGVRRRSNSRRALILSPAQSVRLKLVPTSC